MAEIITVTNQKGGVGKTTVSAALVCGLHQRGARVLGIDLDPQGNLGFTLGLEIGQGRTFYDVCKGNCHIREAVAATEYGDVVPADIMLSAAEVEFSAPRREFILEQHLTPVLPQYDFIIIDTPPSLNILTVNAYVASNSLVIPMEPEILSLVGITQLTETIEAVRNQFNPRLKVLGILMNKFTARYSLHREVLEMAQEVARQLGSRVFECKVRRGVEVAKSPAHGQSVLTYNAKAKPALDLQAFVDWVAGGRFST